MSGNSQGKSSATTKLNRSQRAAVERGRAMALAGNPLARAMFGDDSGLCESEAAFETQVAADLRKPVRKRVRKK